jgi:hypothetical protein
VYGPDGTPLYSWRVLLLAYFEEQDLHAQFRLDEPWNSPHNCRLLDRMPSIYAPPEIKRSLVPAQHTICHVFVGRGTSFEAGERLKLEDDFPDGASNTLLFVEAGEPVLWTKPDELAYDPSGPLPPLRGLFNDGFRACTADGTPRFVRYDTSQDTLRAIITRNGGERFALDW